MKKENIERLDSLHVTELYESGLSTLKIAKDLGVSDSFIWAYLIHKNIPRRRAAKSRATRSPVPIGTKYGMWTVISDEVKNGGAKNNRSLHVYVECICGHTCWRALTDLRSGRSTRCKKCGNKQLLKKDGFEILPSIVDSAMKKTISSIPKRCRKRLLKFNLTTKYLVDLFEKQGRLCALSGIELKIDPTKTMLSHNLSLDRIDSNKDYVEGNVQWVDKRINMMKGKLSDSEFIKLCKEVNNNNNNNNNNDNSKEEGE